ncbi:MAG TPA: endolytic transglycosylase MltG [Candidatus Bacteroides merdavium]|uniref:Endolytic murein transglycosylase n=1 Tax=Candidatus Bacteroides merdavium TaxID=2838472 RepID=A0A9D2GX96_9BACE|nr:endolytic transglycosylase MltG [Candidatus Bacteroides merdavium]
MKKKGLTITLFSLAAACALCLGIGYRLLLAPQFHPKKKVYIYIDHDDTADSVYHKLSQTAVPNNLTGLRWAAHLKQYPKHIKTGRYAIQPGDNAYQVLNRLMRGHQEPMNLVIGSVRTLDKLARNVGNQLMIDSAEIMQALRDTARWNSQGYTPENLPSLFIPETYQVYWDMDTRTFLNRMAKEHDHFWNQSRRAKADSLGMTPAEVATLASIVEEETNNRKEKPIVAGLYINRLRAGIPLQADPTVKFALQDFSLRRITNAHLNFPSPYNTYLNTGLPPGPIRIPSPAGIDAVLNYTRHNYLYMCAKEDFSGTHNFASTYAVHMQNARKYWNALNKRKIFK